MFDLFKKIFNLSYVYDKFGVIKLNLILFFSSIIEGLSIALIFPIVGIIAENKNAKVFFDSIPFLQISSENIIYSILILLITIFLFKSLILLYFSWWKSGFIKELNINFARKMFSNYLREDLNFFLTNKPSILLRNSFDEIRAFISSVDCFFKLLTEIVVFVMISLVLIYFQPKITLVMIFLFGISGFLFTIYTKNLLKNWSSKKLHYAGKLIQILQQSYESIKYLKISGSENKAITDYDKNIRQFSKYARFALFFSDIPKNFLEFLGVLTLVFIIFFLFKFSNSDFQTILPVLGLFAAAAFRIIPGINRIINLIQAIYSTNASIKLVYSDLIKTRNIAEDSKIKKTKFNLIKFKNVSYSYPNSNINVLKGINLEIKKNDCICIIGSSGSGKTTIVDLIVGLLKPTSGKITIDDKLLVSDQDVKNWQRNIGYIPQNTTLYNTTILENITYGKNFSEINKDSLDKAIKYAQLENFIYNQPGGLNYKISERGSNLSGGQMQRFAIARSLYLNPEILICDEFTSSLDENTEDRILDSLNNLVGNTTMVFISHNNKIIKKAHKIIQIRKNKEGVEIIKND